MNIKCLSTLWVLLLCTQPSLQRADTAQIAERENKTFRFEEFADEDTISPSPFEFQPAPRIVSGETATEGQFPYQISLNYNGAHRCGGSIISANFVLTAAHCVILSKNRRRTRLAPSKMYVRAGSILNNAGGVVVNISKIISHPKYGSTNDIALLQLATPLELNELIAPIALNTETIPNGASVLVSGWGRLSTRGKIPTTLQHATFRAITNQVCSRFYKLVRASHLCLAKPHNGVGICFGDSGGPAVYNNRLVGITDFMLDSCGSLKPDGFTRVSSYIDWIKSNSDVVLETKKCEL